MFLISINKWTNLPHQSASTFAVRVSVIPMAPWSRAVSRMPLLNSPLAPFPQITKPSSTTHSLARHSVPAKKGFINKANPICKKLISPMILCWVSHNSPTRTLATALKAMVHSLPNNKETGFKRNKPQGQESTSPWNLHNLRNWRGERLAVSHKKKRTRFPSINK